MSEGLLFTSGALAEDAGLLLTGTAAELRRLASQRPGEILHCALAGTSMLPSLRPEDLLTIVPYGSMPIAVGDVVVCLPADRERPVVHRVASVTPAGIRTHGDSNDGEDPWLLQQADIVGRVVAAWRGQKRYAIPGGWRGRMRASLVRLSAKVLRLASRLAHVPYRALARSGVVQATLPARLKPRLVAFKRADGHHLRLLIGRRVVGEYDHRTCRWQIRRPYRLFVDHQLLSQAPLTTPRPSGSRSGDPGRCPRAQL